jgi:hypothetical protein
VLGTLLFFSHFSFSVRVLKPRAPSFWPLPPKPLPSHTRGPDVELRACREKEKGPSTSEVPKDTLRTRPPGLVPKDLPPFVPKSYRTTQDLPGPLHSHKGRTLNYEPAGRRKRGPAPVNSLRTHCALGHLGQSLRAFPFSPKSYRTTRDLPPREPFFWPLPPKPLSLHTRGPDVELRACGGNQTQYGEGRRPSRTAGRNSRGKDTLQPSTNGSTNRLL